MGTANHPPGRRVARREHTANPALGDQIDPSGVDGRDVNERGHAREQQLAARRLHAGELALVIQRVCARPFEQAGHEELRHAVLLADAAIARLVAWVRVDVDQPRHHQQAAAVDGLVRRALIPLAHERDGVVGKRHVSALEIRVAPARRIPRHDPVRIANTHCLGHRLPPDYRSRSFGLSASLSPSPIRLSASTVSRIATPGMAVRYHSVRSISRPAPIIEPQLITLASPRPRKASADSVRMAVATMIDAVTMIGAAALGRIWRKIMRQSPMPTARQACTNSRCRSAMNSARTRRAIAGHDTRAIAMMIEATEGRAITTTTITKTKGGIVWNASVARIRRSSIRPP